MGVPLGVMAKDSDVLRWLAAEFRILKRRLHTVDANLKAKEIVGPGPVPHGPVPVRSRTIGPFGPEPGPCGPVPLGPDSFVEVLFGSVGPGPVGPVFLCHKGQI